MAKEMPAVDWASFYDKESEIKRYEPGRDPTESLRVDFVKLLLGRLTPRTILDVGCGDGYLCGVLAKRPAATKVVGLDLSTKRMEAAKARYPNVSFVQGNACNLLFADNTFDLVLAVEILEHLENPEIALKELVRVSNRYVVVTTPYNEAPFQVLCPHCMQLFIYGGHLHHNITEETLVAMCKPYLDIKRVDVSRFLVNKPLLHRLLFPAVKRAFPGRYGRGGFVGVLGVKKLPA